MSIQHAVEFMRLARRDKALQRELAALRGAGAVAELTGIAAGRGYTFTEAEYFQAAVADSNGELSEESIDALSREIGL